MDQEGGDVHGKNRLVQQVGGCGVNDAGPVNTESGAHVEDSLLNTLKETMRIAGRAAAKSVRSDRAEWLEAKAAEIQTQLGQGVTDGLWALVRSLSGKKARGPRAVPVLQGQDGEIVLDEGGKALVMERFFLAEFAGRGSLETRADHRRHVEEHESEVIALPPGELPDKEEFTSEFRDAVLAMKARRAMGHDGVPIELVQQGGDVVMDLVTQVAWRSLETTTPAGWRSGKMVPVPKKAGGMHLGNTRGVLLAPHCGKALAKCARTRLATVLKEVAPSQMGAIRGGGCEFVYMTQHYFMKSGAATGRTTIAVFTDLKAAFYTALLEVGVGKANTPAERDKLFHLAAVPADAQAMIKQIVDNEQTEIAKAGLPFVWRRFVADWHSAMSFEVEHGTHRVALLSGCRPGDPLADTAFALVFSAVQKELKELVAELHMQDEVAFQGRGLFADPAEEKKHAALPAPTFMDDLTILVSADKAMEGIAMTVKLVEGFSCICRRFGFELNMAAGKTECIIAPRGEGSQEARLWLDSLAVDGTPTVPTNLGQGLRFVTEYKHVGVMETAAKTQRRETLERQKAGRMVNKALHKRVYTSSKIPRKTKVNVAAATSTSRVFRFTGCRERPSAALRRKTYQAYMTPYRSIVGRGAKAVEGIFIEDRTIRRDLKIAHPECHAIADRLRIAGRVVKHGPDALLGLLQGPAGQLWRSDLVKDLAVIREVLLDRLESLPPPKRDVRPWECLMREHPGCWKTLVSKFVGRSALSEDKFLTACSRAQVCTLAKAEAHVAEGVGEVSFDCDVCQTTYSTEKGLAEHKRQVHGEIGYLRARVVGTTCPFCQGDFRNRARLRTHLYRGAQKCVSRVGELPLLSPAALLVEQEAEAKALKEARKKGGHHLSGPPMLRAVPAEGLVPVAAV